MGWLAWALQQITVRPLTGLLVPLDPAELEQFRNRQVERLFDRAGAKLTL